MSNILERRSIKKYDPSVKISKEEMTLILKEATRAPSSMNMQPWRFFIIESDEFKEKLRPVLHGNQNQLETSAAMIVIFNDLNKYDYAEKIYSKAFEAGILSEEIKDRQIKRIEELRANHSMEKLERVGLLDGGLVAMQLMLIAREHGYETCPIGGFDHDIIADALGLDSKRYKPVVIISIGKGADQGRSSVRLEVDEITEWR